MILKRFLNLLVSNSLFFFLAFCFVPKLSYSASYVENIDLFKNNKWLLEAGGYYAEMGKAQHIDLDAAVGNQYNVSDNNSYNGILGAGFYIGARSVLNHPARYGLQVFYLHRMKVHGTITEENLYTNLSYTYDVNHLPIYAMFKVGNLFNSGLSTDVGIGPNVMVLKDIKEKSLDGGVTSPDNALGGRAKITYSATAAVYTRIKFSTLYDISCGYRFFYLGEGGFKKLSSQLLNTLKTGQSYAHSLMCQISL